MTLTLRILYCLLFGHRWKLLPYEDAPHGWSYENHECTRCGALRRELVAGRIG